MGAGIVRAMVRTGIHDEEADRIKTVPAKKPETSVQRGESNGGQGAEVAIGGLSAGLGEHSGRDGWR
ncbi:hypothetical protein L1887_48030 [Cichorium endivia]|nr:hypothetical protein L1887_48030 [Cichorium endivia]